jgi:hypothetical protein
MYCAKIGRMKIDRSMFPPLTKEDFLDEYLLTKNNRAQFLELMTVPAHLRPGKLKIPLHPSLKAKKRRTAD